MSGRRLIVAESYDGGYCFHKAWSGDVVALCGKRLMQSVKELPIESWGVGSGLYCKQCGRMETGE